MAKTRKIDARFLRFSQTSTPAAFNTTVRRKSGGAPPTAARRVRGVSTESYVSSHASRLFLFRSLYAATSAGPGRGPAVGRELFRASPVRLSAPPRSNAGTAFERTLRRPVTRFSVAVSGTDRNAAFATARAASDGSKAPPRIASRCVFGRASMARRAAARSVMSASRDARGLVASSSSSSSRSLAASGRARTSAIARSTCAAVARGCAAMPSAAARANTPSSPKRFARATARDSTSPLSSRSTVLLSSGSKSTTGRSAGSEARQNCRRSNE